jgi:hypothetical protein
MSFKEASRACYFGGAPRGRSRMRRARAKGGRARLTRGGAGEAFVSYGVTSTARVPDSGQPSSFAAANRSFVSSMVPLATASCTIWMTSAGV